MKYVLLPFAVVLAVFGCFALATSFGTVFDGTPSSLIAGTVALGCGILVAGQFFILRALDALRVAPVRREAELPVASPHFTVEPEAAADLPPAIPQPETIRQPPFPATARKPAPFGFGSTPRKTEPATPPPIPIAVPPAPAEAVSAAHNAPPIDTDLLLAEAMAAPAPVVTEPVAQPESEKAPQPAFDRAPRTSPSLADMWRRVKPAKPSEPAAPLPPPPPLLPPAKTNLPDWAETHIDHAQDVGHDLDLAKPPPTVQPPAIVAPTTPPVPVPVAQAVSDQAAPAVPKPDKSETITNDWLDRALAGIDAPAPPLLPHPLFGGPEKPRATDMPTTDLPEEAGAHPEPKAETEAVKSDINLDMKPEAKPQDKSDHKPREPELGEPAEMGRYQADGTTYIMFTDGSIEAQTEQGLYRFSSMAELKSFFEEQAVAT